MATLFRFSEAAALALHAMAYLAVADEGALNAKTLAKFCGASEAHMTKVCQRLARKGLLSARRGIHGGFAPAKPLGRIRLLDIYSAIEGPVGLKSCLFQTHRCHGHAGRPCIFGERIRGFEEEFLRYMRRTTLAALARECRGASA